MAAAPFIPAIGAGLGIGYTLGKGTNSVANFVLCTQQMQSLNDAINNASIVPQACTSDPGAQAAQASLSGFC